MGSFWYWSAVSLCAFQALVAQPLPYQPSYRRYALAALRDIYNLDFFHAEQKLAKLDTHFGPYVGTAYLRALSYSWRIEIDPTTTWFDSFWERAVKQTDSLLEHAAEHPLEKYFIGFGNAALAVRHQYVRGQMIAAVWKAKELLSFLKGLQKYAEIYPEMQFELGLYEYYIGYFSRNYPIIRPFLSFFPPGDETRGLARLEKCAEDTTNYTHVEAAYFLSYICLYQANQPLRAEKWLRWLTEKFPQNPLFRRMWAEALYHLQRYAQARQVVLPWLREYEKACPKPPCYLIVGRFPTMEAVQGYALVGMTFREEGNYTEARQAFGRMDTLMATLRNFPPPTWARLMREAALLEKRMGDQLTAERRMAALRARKDVPDFLKSPLPE
ncbi:MAG: hypothetical protein RMJ66_02330 [Bacteroidia bacterium]|nr:hypothetical protein [Bacteroidia bacterium]MDW8133883.1 hypothetical protein [Bacteroidia bacterium]